MAAVTARRARVRALVSDGTCVRTIAALLGTHSATIRSDLIALRIDAPESPVWPRGVVVGPTHSLEAWENLLFVLYRADANVHEVCAHFRITQSAYRSVVDRVTQAHAAAAAALAAQVAEHRRYMESTARLLRRRAADRQQRLLHLQRVPTADTAAA